jgi:hypothetical protein
MVLVPQGEERGGRYLSRKRAPLSYLHVADLLMGYLKAQLPVWDMKIVEVGTVVTLCAPRWYQV